jgi:hypothetical protein
VAGGGEADGGGETVPEKPFTEGSGEGEEGSGEGVATAFSMDDSTLDRVRFFPPPSFWSDRSPASRDRSQMDRGEGTQKAHAPHASCRQDRSTMI